MNIIRQVSLNGGYAYSNKADHVRCLERAETLQAAGFGRFVHSTKSPEPNEDGSIPTHQYYSSDRFMVDEKEFAKLKACGAQFTIHDMTQREIIPMQKVSFIIAATTFVTWNMVLVLKVAGVL